MKTLTAVVIAFLLVLVLAGAIGTVFGKKAGVVSLLMLLFLVIFSRRIGPAGKWGK